MCNNDAWGNWLSLLNMVQVPNLKVECRQTKKCVMIYGDVYVRTHGDVWGSFAWMCCLLMDRNQCGLKCVTACTLDVCTCKHGHECIYVPMYASAHVRMYKHAHVRVRTYPCTHASMYAHMHVLCVCMRACLINCKLSLQTLYKHMRTEGSFLILFILNSVRFGKLVKLQKRVCLIT
jgi:hypothetical protein